MHHLESTHHRSPAPSPRMQARLARIAHRFAYTRSKPVRAAINAEYHKHQVRKVWKQPTCMQRADIGSAA